MSVRSFTVLAQSLRKKRDLDLCPARILSPRGPRSSGFHVVAVKKQALALSASRQRCGRLQGEVHPLPAGPRQMEGETERTIPACRLRIRLILLQTPSDGCLRKAPFLPDSPMSHSATRSVLISRPAPLAFCFALPPQQVKSEPAGTPVLRAPCGSGFPKKKSPCGFGPWRGEIFSSEPPQKARLRAWERGTLASLRAGVSRVRTGQIQTGEKQWHSTPTPSL